MGGNNKYIQKQWGNLIKKWPFVVFKRQEEDMMDLRMRKKVNETR